jgi:CheY-like chemotaxis protein
MSMRASLIELLQLCGHEAQVASDGAKALKQAGVSLRDVVAFDIGLPTMDGGEVARRMHQVPGGRRLLLVVIPLMVQEPTGNAPHNQGFTSAC